MQLLQLEIITPEKIAYKSKIESFSIPGTKGNFQVLVDHAPIISTFDIGTIKVELEPDNKIYFATSGGTIEVLKNNIRILADSLEPSESIDLERAKNALERAQKRLEEKSSGDIDVKRAEAALARAMNRIKLVEKLSSAV